ncbi:serine hydrolase domain-containing protein [Jannaschia donghaensis]|uniref:Putative penicillin-binding protein PbpX n=1 Tax=Jannaschia donghaensis TaxID=420998 RepID=A0A0M6YIW8_9RHOB|nr:serine hydrolase domain-containing protein [Jannaschia donghaensis]CTQ49900.1 Putative penicillin-binding protein PbpX [Jannaschia donghaensis]
MIRAALVLLLCAGAVQAQDAVSLRDAADDLAAIAPGAVIGVWTPDAQQTGFAGLHYADGPPLDGTEAFHIGSLTKAMTATLAGRLVDRDLIGWDTTIGDLLEADKAWHDVTLADLLTHRSGMAANIPRLRAILRPTRPAYVAHMLGRPPEGPRGDFLYSNAGYVVAGAMLEAAGGMPWEELIQAEVFGPLGMTGAGFGPPNAVFGHTTAGNPVPPGPRADNLPAMGPAGTLHATATDMLAFLAAHATRTPDYLPPGIWDRLHTPVGDYAMGWGLRDGALVHAGSNTLWFARVQVVPDRAVFVAINQAGAAAEAGTALALTRLAASDLPATPEDPPPQ